MSLLTDLQWYWDLSAADANIVDQHNSLSLSKIGTVTTSETGGPDGGPCIDVGAAAGKYRNASVAKLAAYNSDWSVNIWARSTGTSSTGNWIINHRNHSFQQYFQMNIRSTGTSTDRFTRFSSSNTTVFDSQESLNTWQMLTGVIRGSSHELWRNGVLVHDLSIAGTVTTGNADFAIGGNSWQPTIDTGTNHRGQLAMAGMWNAPLTQSQITTLYNVGQGRRYADLSPIQTRRRRDLGGFGL